MHSETHGMAMRPMSNWRSTTNTKPVIRSELGRLSARRSMNFAAPFKWATLHRSYREIKARFDHRMRRLERKRKRPFLEGLAHQLRREGE